MSTLMLSTGPVREPSAPPPPQLGQAKSIQRLDFQRTPPPATWPSQNQAKDRSFEESTCVYKENYTYAVESTPTPSTSCKYA